MVRLLCGLVSSPLSPRAHKRALWDALQPEAPLRCVRAQLPDRELRVETRAVSLAGVLGDAGVQLQRETALAAVNGTLQDVHAPVPELFTCGFVAFGDSDEARNALWHSAAHVLGDALEQLFPAAFLCDGPPIHATLKTDPVGLAGGFYYEMGLAEGTVQQEHVELLQKTVKKTLSRKHAFERREAPLTVARDMFDGNPYKLSLLDRLEAAGSPVILYRCGDFIDLCRGPHVPSLAAVQSMLLTRATSAQDPETLENTRRRVYGMAFHLKEDAVEWKEARKESERRNHRTIGQKQELYMLSDYHVGSACFLPHGTRVLQAMKTMLRDLYRKHGYEEVETPQVFDKALWEVSGHWENYKDDMFEIQSEGNEHLCLKPMNCPSHCLIYKHKKRSYKELPLRFADFGALHRNEVSGSLTGLTRLRRFHQDDAHIFCTQEHMKDELKSCLDMIDHVYRSKFGFEYRIHLATRPSEFIGSEDLWDQAEAALKELLEERGVEWELNEGDGAFYGPKIDIALTDALRRQHQCATVQLDFQLPRRFELEYVDADGTAKTPVMIHRAILGSFERMFAILTEHTAGRWPLWLSPRQVMVCTVNNTIDEYAADVHATLASRGLYADLDTSAHTISKKVRQAQQMQYNYILILGNTEATDQTLSLRSRDGKVEHGTTMSDLLALLDSELRTP